LATGATARLHDEKPSCFDQFSHEIAKKTRGCDQFLASPIQPEIEFFKNSLPCAYSRQTKKANASALTGAEARTTAPPTFRIGKFRRRP
jgi:hypothetical protein